MTPESVDPSPTPKGVTPGGVRKRSSAASLGFVTVSQVLKAQFPLAPKVMQPHTGRYRWALRPRGGRSSTEGSFLNKATTVCRTGRKEPKEKGRKFC